MRISTTMKREDGKVIYIRKSSGPEPNHKEIYKAMDLPFQVEKTLKAIM